MARSDLLLSLLRAGRTGDQGLLRRVAEALISEERAKGHPLLADRLEQTLRQDGLPSPPSTRAAEPPIDGLVYEVSPSRKLDEVVLLPPVEAICREIVEEHARVDLLRSYNLEPRHRVLLMGPPGNGKTTLAEALAYELMLPLYVVRYEGVIASYLGETASRIGRLFDFVRTRKCVLFFDEFDAVAKERGDPHDTGEVKRVVSSLLLQIDALPSHVVVITASNHPELLDRAVWRRFQVRLTLSKPTPEQRAEFVSRFLGNIRGNLPVSVEGIVRDLGAVSFSDIEEFAVDVQRKAILTGPEANLRVIIKKSLRQWRERSRAQASGAS
jgi:SpoVK/Ycf46/Vps4 family AAA+-type ATPase